MSYISFMDLFLLMTRETHNYAELRYAHQRIDELRLKNSVQ